MAFSQAGLKGRLTAASHPLVGDSFTSHGRAFYRFGLPPSPPRPCVVGIYSGAGGWFATEVPLLSGFILLALAGAAADPGADSVKLAAPGLSAVNMTAEVGRFYSDHLAQQLSLQGVRVITSSEMATLLGFERQKEMMGCSEKSSSCVAELANALGVDGIVSGSVGKFGSSFQVNVKVISAVDGQALSIYSGRVAGEEQLLDELTTAARAIAPELFRKLNRKQPAVAAGPPSGVVTGPATGGQGLRTRAWVPLAAGGALVVGGGVLMLQAAGKADALRSASPSKPLEGLDAARFRDEGKLFQTAGVVCLGVGAASLVAGGLMALLGGSSAGAVQPAVAVGPGGAIVGIAGALP